MASALSNIVAKDGTPSTISGGILAVDKQTSGAGTGPFIPTSVLVDTQGVNTATIRAASSGAAAATDTAFVVSVRDANANVQSGAPVTVVAQTPTATANGATDSRVNSAATTNATSLKATPGQLYDIDVFNTAAYVVYLKLYNKASAPTVGTDTPVRTIPIQAGGGYSKNFPMGKAFSLGIAYAITKLQADSDTTVVVAGDLTGSMGWM